VISAPDDSLSSTKLMHRLISILAQRRVTDSPQHVASKLDVQDGELRRLIGDAFIERENNYVYIDSSN